MRSLDWPRVEAMTFSALGEPTRLRIVELLRDGPCSVGDIADSLVIRQPQASKHLKVLADVGIVVGERLSKRRIYRLEPTPFTEVAQWADSFDHLWLARLDSLGRFLDASSTGRSPHGDEEG
jgi:DNA-binding transcriptional ArsR family regulator